MQSHYDYVLIGSFAAVWAAQSIRALDPQGSIAIIGAENHPPYDRPPLSKGYLSNDEIAIDDAYSKFDDFYPKNNIDLHRSTRVVGIDRAAQTVTLEDGGTIGYGKLLLATGSRPNPLDVPGANRPNVHLLRTIDDSLSLREIIRKSKSVVIVGAGYIGMEVAAGAKTCGLEVTVIEPTGHPWSKFAGAEFGKFLQSYYERQGVRFVIPDEVDRFDGEGEDGPAARVTTKGGQVISADFVVVGIGVTLNTELAKEAGLEGVDPKNGVKVNEFLQTSDPHIWAAGDIACFTDSVQGVEWHAEHHLNAKWQGQTAGKNMAGTQDPYNQVAYFFSDEFDIHVILRGYPQGGRHSFFVGDVEGAEFIELYHDDAGRLTMGIAVSHEEPKLDPISDTLERLIRARVNVGSRKAEIQSPGFDLNRVQ